MRTVISILCICSFHISSLALAQETCEDIGGTCFEGCPDGWVSPPPNTGPPVTHPPEWYGDEWGCFDSACCIPTEAQVEPTTAPTVDPAYQITVDGASVWPPRGAGCESFVACCDAMAHEGAVLLTCQLAVASDPDCLSAMTTVLQIMTELGVEPAPACAP